MDLKAEIADYLEDVRPHYFDGIYLLEQCNFKGALLNNLRRKENKQHTAKLRWCLEKCLKEGIPQRKDPRPKRKYTQRVVKDLPQPVATPFKGGHSPIKVNMSEETVTTTPSATTFEDHPVFHQLSQKKGEIHMERAAMANRMKLCRNNAQRKEVYEACDEIQERYDAVAKQIEHYRKHGEMIEVAAKPKTSSLRLSDNPIDWPRQLNNARSNRTKLQKKIDSVTDGNPNLAKWKPKLNQLKVDIDVIEAAIKAQ